MLLFKAAVYWDLHSLSTVDLLNGGGVARRRDSGLTRASLYDNAQSRRFLIEPRDVMVLHNFYIKKADTAAAPARRREPGASPSAADRPPSGVRHLSGVCALICFLNLTGMITLMA